MKIPFSGFCLQLRGTSSLLIVLLMLLMSPVLSGCYYYRVHTYEAPVKPERASKLIRGKKYFILHQNTGVWHLKEGSVDFDGKDLEGTKEPLPAKHRYYKTVNTKHNNRFRPSKPLARVEREHVVPDESVYEVHIYVSDHTGDEGDDVVVPLAAIRKIEVYEIARGVTASSHIFPIMGGIIIGATGLLVLYASTATGACGEDERPGRNFSLAGSGSNVLSGYHLKKVRTFAIICGSVRCSALSMDTCLLLNWASSLR